MALWLAFTAFGSSPRVWGRRDQSLPTQLTDRFIPTRVGQTAKPRNRVTP